MLLKIVLNLIISPMFISLLPSILFWYLNIGNLEWYKWFIIFVVLHWYKETKITF